MSQSPETDLSLGQPTGCELFDLFISPSNIQNAWKRVAENGGSAGVDGMTVSELQKDFPALWRPVEESLRAESWQPAQLKRVAVPKLTGGTRILKIPNVLDRVVLQAVAQVLQPMWEPWFSNHSYAYRPQRSAHDAVITAQNFIGTGEGWVVDLDIESFFDRVDCARLIRRMEEKPYGENFTRLSAAASMAPPKKRRQETVRNRGSSAFRKAARSRRCLPISCSTNSIAS